MSDFQPDLLVVGSDGIDFCGISHFDRDPARVKAGGVQGELDVWMSNQREWADAAGEALRWFIPGNHEDRLRKYVWRHPELFGLKALSLPKLLELDELGIGYDDSDELIIDDSLVIKHGSMVRSHSAMTARAELENERHAMSVITGHTHRGGSFYAMTRGGPVTGSRKASACAPWSPTTCAIPTGSRASSSPPCLRVILSVEPVLAFPVSETKSGPSGGGKNTEACRGLRCPYYR